MTLVAPLLQNRLDLRSKKIVGTRTIGAKHRHQDENRQLHAPSLLSISRAAFITSSPTASKQVFGIRRAIPETQTVASKWLGR
jgi:hypothetical protein